MIAPMVTAWTNAQLDDLAEHIIAHCGETELEDVWLCGSRVFGEPRPDSDLDVCIKGSEITLRPIKFRWEGITVTCKFHPDPTATRHKGRDYTIINLGTRKTRPGNPEHEAARMAEVKDPNRKKAPRLHPSPRKDLGHADD